MKVKYLNLDSYEEEVEILSEGAWRPARSSEIKIVWDRGTYLAVPLKKGDTRIRIRAFTGGWLEATLTL